MPTMTDPGDVREDQAGTKGVERADAHEQKGAKPLNDRENDDLKGIEAGFGKDGQEPSRSTHGLAGGSHEPAAKGSSSGSGAAAASSASTSAPKNVTATGASNFAMATQFASNHRGKLIGGGLVGLLIAMAFAAFLATLPLKLESMMENIFEKRVGNRIEHYMENRAASGMEGAIADGLGDDKAIVTTGSPWLDLYKTLKTRNFQKDLKERTGKSFKVNPDGKTIDMYQDGELVGNISKGEAIGEFNQAISDSTHWVQFYKRMHLRSWMKNAYGITKWDFFKNVVNKIKCKVTTCTSDDAAETEVDTELVADAEPAVTEGAADALTCGLGAALGGGGAKCIDDEGDPDDPGLEGGDTIADVPSSETGGAQDDTVTGAVTDATGAAETDTTNTIAKDGGTLLSKTLTKFLGQELTTKLADAFAAAKGPLIIIAGIDIASRIDHFFWFGEADKVVVNIHKVQYAAEFAEWMIISNNWKDGHTVSGDEFNATAQKLNGTEKSAASQCIYTSNCTNAGQGITTVSDGDGGTTTDGNRSINETALPIEAAYRADPVAVTFHYPLDIWYSTAGKVWGAINNVLGGLTSLILKAAELVDPFLKGELNWLMSHIAAILLKVVLLLVKPAVDGTEAGADLMNGLDAGGAVTGMDFARNLGAPQMSATAAAQLDGEIAQEQIAAADKMSIATRLFSTDYTNSLVNTLALEAPSTPAGAVSDSMGYVASITANPMKVFAPLLKIFNMGPQAEAAANTADGVNYGLIDWGYTDAQLNVNDTAALNQAWANAQKRLGTTPTYGDLQLSDCPAVADPNTMPNVCRLDIATIQSLGAAYTTADDGGLGGQ